MGAKMFNREELQDISNRAFELAADAGMVSIWRRALGDFGDAADRLDAMIARTAIQTPDCYAHMEPLVG